MSKFDEKLALYTDEFSKLKIEVDSLLLKKVTKGCGPIIYVQDASKVATSDKVELDRVKENFLIKRLGLPDNGSLDEGINTVIDIFGSSNSNKHRAMFYYLLVKHFKKESVYIS